MYLLKYFFSLYRLIEKELCAIGYPITSWARAIAIFIMHSKNELLNSRLNDQQLLGKLEDFKRIFPEIGGNIVAEDLRYNHSLLTDFLEEPR